MILFESESKSAAFWFAAEEYIMRFVRPVEPVLMLWSTDDTIMVGANQVVAAECDLEYARAEGIEIVRRSSGGGTIFTDPGTLQYTIILPYGQGDEEPGKTPYMADPGRDLRLNPRHGEEASYKNPYTVTDPGTVTREWLAGPVKTALARYGAQASLEGRNDITIDGKKISGLAQYIKDGYICSHGSLLFKTDLEKLARCLTADREKFTTKAVASVRARVANISDYIALQDLRSFREALIEAYEPSERRPLPQYEPNEEGAHPLSEVITEKYEPNEEGAHPLSEVITEKYEPNKEGAHPLSAIMTGKYYNPEWTYGREPAFTFTNRKRFPGGLIEVFLDVKGGIIRNAIINGDFLALRPVEELEAKLKGAPHRSGELEEALKTLDVRSYLGSLDEAELLEVLL